MRIILATLVVILMSGSLTFAQPIEWPVASGGNGHSYERVTTPINFQAAKSAAVASRYNGVHGHLATITSVAEQNFVCTTISQGVGDYLLGGFQSPGSPEPAGGWTWVTGEPWSFTSWTLGEPNNNAGNQDCLVTGSCGWDDSLSTDPHTGYIVEYPLASDLASTTIITHGLELDGNKPPWVKAMGQAILQRAQNGTAFKYLPATGEWEFLLAQSSPPQNDPNLHIVLLYDWAEDSNGVSNDGDNWRYTDAAGDALYAALRDPRFVDKGILLPPIDLLTDRTVHLIGHSRGACVNSEAGRRLALAPIPVDQMTTLDPHPVGVLGDGCIVTNPQWGDEPPTKWSNVTWCDNYWRADGIEGCHNCDFDGMPLALVYNVPLSDPLGEGPFDPDVCDPLPLPCTFEHTLVHAWYHGTIDTSAKFIDGCDIDQQDWYSSAEENCSNSACCGFYHSAIVGGTRASQAPGIAPESVPVLFNGTFDLDTHVTYAGWRFHGGDIADDSIVTEDGATFLKLGRGYGTVAEHNRFYLPSNAQTISFSYRVFASATNGEFIEVILEDVANGTEYSLGILGVSNTTIWNSIGWQIPTTVAREKAYLLEFKHGFYQPPVQAIVGIDNVAIVSNVGRTIHVPADFPTIQLAIDASQNGDEVVVEPGTYFEAISLHGKSIALKSSGGPLVTTIDATAQNASAITCNSNEQSSTQIEGFTIQHGTGTLCSYCGGPASATGGGILCCSSSPTIRSCIIRYNQAPLPGADGGGISCVTTASPFIDGCTIMNNSAAARGAGVYVRCSSPVIHATVFDSNGPAPFGGGGIAGGGGGGTATLLSCTFKGNSNFAISIGEVQFILGDCLVCSNIGSIDGVFVDVGGNVFLTLCPPPGDITGDGHVNVDDLLAVINGWGLCPQPCPPHCLADVAPAPNGDCTVNVDDLLTVINNWG